MAPLPRIINSPVSELNDQVSPVPQLLFELSAPTVNDIIGNRDRSIHRHSRRLNILFTDFSPKSIVANIPSDFVLWQIITFDFALLL